MALSTGLVSFWSLVSDSLDALSANNGTDTAITHGANGASGNGSTSKIDVGSANLNFLAEFSCAFRVVPTVAGTYVFLVCRTASSGAQINYEIFIDTNDKLTFYSGIQSGVKPAALVTGTTYYVVATRSAGGTCNLYVNGVIACAPWTTGTVQNIPGASTYFGTRDDFLSLLNATQIRDIGLWNRELSAAEALALYNGGSGLTYAELIANPPSFVPMKNYIGLYQVTGSVEKVVTNTLASALAPVSGNINVRRSKERKKYDRLIQGVALRSEVGEAPIPGSPSSYSQQLATVPSWTQSKIGKKHAYVSHALSSSVHEVSRLNTYSSGVFKLEDTIVAASGSRYYEKTSRLVTKVYKLSASVNLPNPAWNGNSFTMSEIEFSSSAGVRSGTFADVTLANSFHPVSGSYRNNSSQNPAEFVIDVPDYGRIRDVKVWVEFIHDLRGGLTTHTTSGPFAHGGVGLSAASASYQQIARQHGLGGIEISLKSPNVSFDLAHPLWNDKKTAGFPVYPQIKSDQYQDVRSIPSTLIGSYLLWSGHKNRQDMGYVVPDLTGSNPDNTWSDEQLRDGTASTLITISSDRDDTDNVWALYNSGSDDVALAYTGSLFGNSSRGWRYSKVNEFATTLSPLNFRSHLFVDRKNSVPHIVHGDVSGTFFRLMYSTSASTGGFRRTCIFSSSLIAPYPTQVTLHPTTNEPHFVYSTTENTAFGGAFFHAVSSSSGISTEKIPNMGDVPVLGFQNGPRQIAFDSSGNLNVLCRTETYNGSTLVNASVILMRSSSIGGWSRQEVTRSLGLNSSAIAIDSRDNVHALLGDVGLVSGPNMPAYAVSSSSGWSLKTLDLNAPGGGIGDMRLDSKGRPHFVMLSTMDLSSSLVYARSGSGGLSVSSIYISGADTHASFVLDTRDLPRVFAYHTPSGKNHYYVKQFMASSSAYFEYDRDIDMRTIFSDASPVENPRSLIKLYVDPKKDSPGSSSFWTDKVLGSRYPSPSSASLAFHVTSSLDLRRQFGGFTNDSTGFLTGSNFPWFYDRRVLPGNFLTHVVNVTPGSSPPAGWLTGPAQTAATGEWPTTGSTLGPETIRPVYPLLDDVYVEKIFDQPLSAAAATGTFQPPSQRSRLIGFRPGLRGTEVHGKWRLLIATPSRITNQVAIEPQDQDVYPDTGVWFRQFRLEFLLDQGPVPSTFTPSSGRRHSRTNHPLRPGLNLVDIVSGSSTWDVGVNYVYTAAVSDHGQTLGIITNTGSLSQDFAVFSRLTGALADAYPNFEDWYLHNEFGTPSIPISSGTAFPSKFDPFTNEDSAHSRETLDRVLNPRSGISADNSLRAFVSRADVTKTTRQQIEEASATVPEVLPVFLILSGSVSS